MVEFLFKALRSARGNIISEMRLHDGLEDLLKEFQTRDFVDFMDTTFSTVEDLKILRSIRDQFYPSNPTIAFLLRLGLDSIDLHHQNISAEDKVSKLKRIVHERSKDKDDAR